MAEKRGPGLLGALKALWYIVVAVGVGFYLYSLYASQAGWSVELAEPPALSYVPPTSLEVRVTLQVYNPSGQPVFLRNTWLQLFAGNRYLGEVFLPYTRLEPGVNRLVVKTTIDLRDLPCAVAEAWASGKPVEIRAMGWTVFTVYAFGKIPVRDITVPINTTAYAVEPPAGTAMVLQGVATLCKLAEEGGKLVVRLP